MPWVYSKTPYITYDNNNYENQLESTILLVKQNLLVIVVSINYSLLFFNIISVKKAGIATYDELKMTLLHAVCVNENIQSG